MITDAMQALNRFGLGRQGSTPLPTDPAGWLAAQLAAPDPARFPGLPSTADGLRALAADRAAIANGMIATRITPMLRADRTAMLQYLATADAGFRERLVLFWTNHFAVSFQAEGVATIVGPMIREAIRPHVTGQFGDMLLAVMSHPAMLLYLNNAASVGPDSPMGKRTGEGLNENLARECLELHTVGTGAGYTQADVTAFAAVLTGWTVLIDSEPVGFTFSTDQHEPGSKTVMGQTVPQGQVGGELMLAWLARHPATYMHLATKLVTHFVADVPPLDAVAFVARALANTGGNLGTAASALIEVADAWVPLTKLRTPQDYLIAVVRALNVPPSPAVDLPGILAELGQGAWAPPLPNGWSDLAADWAAPESLLRRIDAAWSLAIQATAVQPGMDPMAVAQDALGPLLSPATAAAIAQANGTRGQGPRPALAALFSAPEFMRR